MALSSTQLEQLQGMLTEQLARLTNVMDSLKAGDPASNPERTNDNADIGNEATESSQLVEYESLERETQILLDRTQHALEQIKAGTYGITEEGKEIPFERLLIDPTATTTV
ncbi:hypothetical protein KBD71_01070 [Candidatus Woesebacteria bacterium]|nr:hypothetical protein [Candidatus Woesebacteria bacterium]